MQNIRFALAILTFILGAVAVVLDNARAAGAAGVTAGLALML